MTDTDDEFAGFGADDDGWDLAEVLWLPGVDYVGAWRAAKVEADALNAAFRAAGLAASEVRAVVVSLADGSAALDFRVSVPGARRLAGLVRRGQ